MTRICDNCHHAKWFPDRKQRQANSEMPLGSCGYSSLISDMPLPLVAKVGWYHIRPDKDATECPQYFAKLALRRD